MRRRAILCFVAHRIDIVIPVYNEKENFQTTVDLIGKRVKSDWRILMVYDFAEDSTVQIAKPLSQLEPRLRLVQNSSRGALNAIKTGFKVAEADAVLLLMVDDPPAIIEQIDPLVEKFYSENASIGVASRYMRGGEHVGGPWLKGFLSRMAGLSLYYVIGLPTHDATYATRLYRKSFLNSVTIEAEKGFEMTLELTLKAYFRNEKIVEIPVSWHERLVGESKFPLIKWLPAYLKWYFWGIKMRYMPLARKKSLKT